MKQKRISSLDLTPAEAQLIQRLREHPHLQERVQAILAIVRNAEGPLKSADEVEGLLVQEMRKLGNTSMCQWIEQAQERVSKELKEQNPGVLSRKKKR
jgi:hypothetical protein